MNGRPFHASESRMVFHSGTFLSEGGSTHFEIFGRNAADERVHGARIVRIGSPGKVQGRIAD